MADSDKTAAPSHEPSVLGEKGVVEAFVPATTTAVPATEPAAKDETNTVETLAADATSNASASDEEDDFQYPDKGRLAAITIALCLSVFCMALVRQRFFFLGITPITPYLPF